MSDLDEHQKKLIQRYADDIASEEELLAFFGLLNETDADDFLLENMDQEIQRINTEVLREQKTPVHWLRYAIAASILIAVGLGLHFFSGIFSTREAEAVVYQTDIAPGIHTATLTLANGHKIDLATAANGKLAEEKDAIVNKTADGQIVYAIKGAGASALPEYNIMSTTRGQEYQLTLPDGTKVWLNTASSLKYPSSFAAASSRKVELKGEAYFEVAKDKAHPFLVTTGKQEVEVLGTHFNINAYDDDPNIRTTLLEGSVRVTEGTQLKVLRPGQQSVSNGNDLRVNEVDTEGVVAWKNGYFDFNEENLENIMNKIARWYDVTVVYKDPELKTQIFTGNISKFSTVSKVLKKIALSNIVHFNIEGRTITVIK